MMRYEIFWTVGLFMLNFIGGKAAAELPLGALVHDGPATPEQISLYIPVSGPLATTTITHVRYRQEPGGSWKVGHPLFRIRPEFSQKAVPDAFAGVITGLKPGTTYFVEVTVSDASSTDRKTLEHTTRTLPQHASAPTKKIPAGSTATQIQTAFDDLLPGDVIEIANGIYGINELKINRSGTPQKPIIIRGESRSGTILRDTNGRILHLLKASDIVIERLTLAGSSIDSSISASSEGVRFWNGAAHQNVTIRDVTIRGVDKGIVSAGALSGILIYDCTLVGNNEWTAPFLESNTTWNDDGIQIPGTGNAAFNNTLYGFGDAFAVCDGVANKAIHFYRNDVLMTGDDAFEGDYAHRNITFYDNRIHNSMTFVSFDPLRGGPAFIFRNITVNTGRQPYKFNATNTGQFIYNNTVVRTQGFSSGENWAWVQFHNGAIRAWGYRNNILIYKGRGKLLAMESSGQNPIDFTNNAWFPDGSIWWTRSGGSFRSLSEAHAKLPSTTSIFSESIHRHDYDVISESNPFETPIVLESTYLTEITARYIPSLAASSRLRNAGVIIPGVTDGFAGQTPDMGAIISGLPVPQWGDRLAKRQNNLPLPPSKLTIRGSASSLE